MIIATPSCFCNHNFKNNAFVFLVTAHMNIESCNIYFSHTMICRATFLQTVQALHWSVLYMSKTHQGPLRVCERSQTVTGGFTPHCFCSARNLRSVANSKGTLCPFRAATVKNSRHADWQIDLQSLLKTMWPLVSRCNLSLRFN